MCGPRTNKQYEIQRQCMAWFGTMVFVTHKKYVCQANRGFE